MKKTIADIYREGKKDYDDAVALGVPDEVFGKDRETNHLEMAITLFLDNSEEVGHRAMLAGRKNERKIDVCMANENAKEEHPFFIYVPPYATSLLREVYYPSTLDEKLGMKIAHCLAYHKMCDGGKVNEQALKMLAKHHGLDKIEYSIQGGFKNELKGCPMVKHILTLHFKTNDHSRATKN